MHNAISATVLVASAVFLAAIHPGLALAESSDLVGVYFEEEGLTSTFQTSSPMEFVIAYVVLKNISAAEGFNAIAIDARIEGTAGTFGGFCWSSLIGGKLPICYPSFVIGAEPPIPQQPSVAVVRMSFWVATPEDAVRIFIIPTARLEYGAPVYNITGTMDLVPLTPTSGSSDEPVAFVNEGVVSATPTSWGQVKALY